MKSDFFIKPFTAKTYRSRRQRLIKTLAKEDASFVCVFFSGREKTRNDDVHFAFRAESDFLYLTGFEEPEAFLVMENHGNKSLISMGLRPRDLSTARGSEIWDGRRLGVEEAPKILQVDAAFDRAQWFKKVKEAALRARVLYWPFGLDLEWDQEILAMVREISHANRGRSKLKAIKDARDFLHEQRKIKSNEEIQVMRASAAIASEGHIRAMKSIQPGWHEYQVAAEVERTFKQRGALSPSYGSIAATGANACTLHYVKNDAVIKNNDLFLLDAGAELFGYASDITRTFPASGKFTPIQKRVYEWVLKSQLAAIRAVKPGATIQSPHQAALRVLIRALKDLKVIKGSMKEILKKKTYSPYFPHGTSHWLGLDVHDSGTYTQGPKPEKLRPGMVLTVEPGLYFRPDQKEVRKELRGIGIRIEDDVLVTSRGNEVLTADCPKTVKEIESLKVPRL